MGLRRWILDGVSAVPRLASRFAIPTLLLVLVASLALANGARDVTFEDNQIDLLPRDSPHTAAARNVSAAFPQNYFVSSIDFVIDPVKAAKANAQLPNRRLEANLQNVTDEVYVRGLEEFNLFFLEHVPSARYNITLDSYVRLIHYTNSGQCAMAGTCAAEPDPRAFDRLPGTDPKGELDYAVAWTTMETISFESIQAIVGPNWDMAQSAFIFVPGPNQTTADVGHEAIAGWEAYRAWAPENAQWDVFDLQESHITTKDPIILDAHTSDVTRDDLVFLTPFVAVFLVVSLYAAFRSVRGILVTAGLIGLAALWTFGIMGYADIPLNTVNLALVPLILGAGIDYSIHVVTEYLEHRRAGLAARAAFDRAGRAVGPPLMLATATTVGGLLVMAWSPSILLAQVGFVGAIAMASVFLLSLTFIPAALTLAGGGPQRGAARPSRGMATFAAAVAQRAPLVWIVVVLVSGASFVAASQVETETYGTPALNFPEGDWLREQYAKENRYFFGSESPSEKWVTDFLIFEGDLTDPVFHDYLRQVQWKLANSSYIRSDRIMSIQYVIEEWKLIEAGTTGAVLPFVQEQNAPGSTYPTTREDIERTLDDLFASPFATYGSLFINHPEHDIGILLLEVKSGDGFEETEAAWDDIWSRVDSVQKPDDVQVHIYGNTATSYLFVKEQLPWLTYMGAASLVIVVALMLFFTGRIRQTLAVASMVVLTTAWWLAILPFVDIGLSIALLLPIVFINAVGSDYAVLLTWNLSDRMDGHRIFGTTGKAVLWSAVTDAGAFAIFGFMTYLLMGRAMVATALAFAVTFVCTMLVIPLFYRKSLPPARALREWDP